MKNIEIEKNTGRDIYIGSYHYDSTKQYACKKGE